MSRYVRIAIIFLTAALFYRCDNEEVMPSVVDEKVFANPSRELDGKYDLIGLISEKPVDLDRDGKCDTGVIKLDEKSVNHAGIMLNAELVKGKLLLTIKQWYYTTIGWEELTINATYKRRV